MGAARGGGAEGGIDALAEPSAFVQMVRLLLLILLLLEEEPLQRTRCGGATRDEEWSGRRARGDGTLGALVQDVSVPGICLVLGATRIEGMGGISCDQEF